MLLGSYVGCALGALPCSSVGCAPGGSDVGDVSYAGCALGCVLGSSHAGCALGGSCASCVFGAFDVLFGSCGGCSVGVLLGSGTCCSLGALPGSDVGCALGGSYVVCAHDPAISVCCAFAMSSISCLACACCAYSGTNVAIAC